MNRLYLSQPFTACYENDLDAFIPELWAREGLALLNSNLVMAQLVNRDFEPEVAKFGDVVNTRRPGEFKIRRKKDGTPLVQQDATATNVQVPLDQWFYSSFVIRDGEGTKSFQELSQIYLQPAMKTIAEGVDRALLGRVHAYLGGPSNRVGKLGGLSASTAKDCVLDAREKLNISDGLRTLCKRRTLFAGRGNPSAHQGQLGGTGRQSLPLRSLRQQTGGRGEGAAVSAHGWPIPGI